MGAGKPWLRRVVAAVEPSSRVGPLTGTCARLKIRYPTLRWTARNCVELKRKLIIELTPTELSGR